MLARKRVLLVGGGVIVIAATALVIAGLTGALRSSQTTVE